MEKIPQKDFVNYPGRQSAHPTLFISTGEVSGDLQGAMLVQALQHQATQRGIQLKIVALGGDRMAAAGATLLGKTTEIGSVGVLESLPFVLPTWRVQQAAKRYLRHNPPDLLVLLDYLGPNLAIGNYLRQHLPQVPIIYYIAPQAWVWSPFPQTTRQLIKITDRLLAIFRAEAQFFEAQGVEVTWVGHPLVDRMQNAPNRENARIQLGIKPEDVLIALLPASRRQELQYLLPVMLAAARRIQTQLPQAEFIIPLSLPAFRAPIAAAIARYKLQATVLEGQPLDAIAAADLAIAKSGTVNLEIALLNVPQVVLYRVNPITMWIARHLFNFRVPYISPANLVTMQPVVPELLQEQATPQTLAEVSLSLLLDANRRQKMLADYQHMQASLGQPGASDRAAKEILDLLETQAASREQKV